MLQCGRVHCWWAWAWPWMTRSVDSNNMTSDNVVDRWVSRARQQTRSAYKSFLLPSAWHQRVGRAPKASSFGNTVAVNGRGEAWYRGGSLLGKKQWLDSNPSSDGRLLRWQVVLLCATDLLLVDTEEETAPSSPQHEPNSAATLQSRVTRLRYGFSRVTLQ